MPITTDVPDAPPPAGEKRSIIPGGKTRILKDRPSGTGHIGRSKVIADRLRLEAKAKAEQPKEENSDAGAAEQEGQGQDEIREAVHVEPENQENAPEASGGETPKEDKEPVAKDGDGGKQPEKDLGSQFSALARAEKRLREERRAWAEEQKKAQDELQSLRELKQIADRDKYQLLDHLGLDVEEWARRTLGKASPEQATTADKQLIDRIEALERQNQELVKMRERQEQQAQYGHVKNTAIAEINSILQNDKERYELTSLRGGADVVFATIEEHYHNTGQILGYQDAADLVEAHFDNEAKEYLKASKVQRRLAPQGEPKGASRTTQSSGKEADTKPRRTVNHAADRVSAAGLTRSQRRERAIAAMKASS